MGDYDVRETLFWPDPDMHNERRGSYYWNLTLLPSLTPNGIIVWCTLSFTGIQENRVYSLNSLYNAALLSGLGNASGFLAHPFKELNYTIQSSFSRTLSIDTRQ